MISILPSGYIALTDAIARLASAAGASLPTWTIEVFRDNSTGEQKVVIVDGEKMLSHDQAVSDIRAIDLDALQNAGRQIRTLLAQSLIQASILTDGTGAGSLPSDFWRDRRGSVAINTGRFKVGPRQFATIIIPESALPSPRPYLSKKPSKRVGRTPPVRTRWYLPALIESVIDGVGVGGMARLNSLSQRKLWERAKPYMESKMGPSDFARLPQTTNTKGRLFPNWRDAMEAAETAVRSRLESKSS